MPPKPIFGNSSPDHVLNVFVELYKEEYGNKKFESLREKIRSSSKIHSFLLDLKNQNTFPAPTIFFNLLHDIPWFLFAKAETTCCGAFVLIATWANHFTQIPHAIKQIHVSGMIIDTLEAAQAQKMNQNAPNFFSKFFARLQVQSKIPN